ncbi:MAG: MarR family transcriptional regulator [Nonomuraea sp.]|nr:MarR family transcriptional regulator [Nonomuraea sp.]NUP67543.1 MarR family transcriptional regulator [Nonomuraea sp.]NUP78082.1 MarR family transcriptional regulator [Nonomuraea sp.]
MDEVKPVSVAGTMAFRIGTLGAIITERFAAALVPLELKPKHVGLLTLLEARGAASQLDVARTMGVAPSLVVTLADHLERLGAISRVRDAEDRRRQLLDLTDEGRALLGRCLEAALELDAELTGRLGPQDRAVLGKVLGTLAAQAGLPV